MCDLQKSGDLFILTLTGDGEHRLNPTLIDSIRSALTRVKTESTRPTALITTAQGKFFCNGYDLSWAQSDPTRRKIMSRKLRLLVADLISLPMPTIAAVTGHVSAAGIIPIFIHDYILMRKDRGFLFLNDLEIGLKIPNWSVPILKSKIGSPQILRNMVLAAPKVTAAVGVDWGIVDSAHDGVEGTVEAAVKLGVELVGRKWDGGVYAGNRRTLFSDVLAGLGSDETVGDDESTEGVSKM